MGWDGWSKAKGSGGDKGRVRVGLGLVGGVGREGAAPRVSWGEAGRRRAGQDRTGQDRTGQGWTGQDRAGQGRAGQDRTGQDRTGQGRAGQGSVMIKLHIQCNNGVAKGDNDIMS